MRVERPPGVHLGNWREQPYSPWAFQHLNELVPSARIRCAEPRSAETSPLGLERITGEFPLASPDLATFLERTSTSALRVDVDGVPAAGWQTDQFDQALPHLLFSVSKSITAMVAGIVQHQGLLDPRLPVSHYLDAPEHSAYRDARVQDVLDMTVALDFAENYNSDAKEYLAYRRASGWNPVNQKGNVHGLREFILPLKKLEDQHGREFRYRSPNSDLLGLVLEAATGESFAALASELLWRPMGASGDALITVDHFGAPRTAGGICATLDDVQRLAWLLCNDGVNASGIQVLPPDWINDTFHNGNPDAWQNGEFSYIFPAGKYRNKWYQSGNADNVIYAMGIHGQYVYINPIRKIVATRLAAQHLPVDDPVEAAVIQAFDLIADRMR